MPKKVDHTERRRLIADALMRVAAEQGLEAVSLRHVAAAADVSAGMVQHYFRTKDEMMTFALSVVKERSQLRAEAAIARLGDDPHPKDLLRTLLTALLPLDEASREDGRVALAFLAYTAVRPQATANLHTETQQMVGFIAGLLPAAPENAAAPQNAPPNAPETAPQNAPETAPQNAPGNAADAAALLALMEGLGLYVLGGQYTPEQATAALDAHLDRLFGAGEKR
ncbi:TetR family transcriptional regulator [Actinoplanes sp. NPDC049596]|uniref:TetR/AcrR family transcriptional regulator n=1 Tax=unclassified Actinoplanes TaxID=2626549 RepID=UPI00342DAEC3